MSVFDLFRPKCRVVIQEREMRCEVEGSARDVEALVDRIFAARSRTLVALAEAQRIAPTPPPPSRYRDIHTISGRGATPLTRRRFIRLHSIQGPLSKVYSLDPRRLQRAPLFQSFDVARVSNIYVEGANLSRHIKSDKDLTIWHTIVPAIPEATPPKA